MSGATTALIVASTAISAIGAIKAGQAQQATYDAQAQAQDYNAKVATNNARVAADQANAQEEQQRRKFSLLQGEALAGAAQSGAGMDGSNKDMLAQNDLFNELDALTIRYKGQNEANGLIAQSELDKYQAKAARANGDAAMEAGYWNAGANILAGASNYNMASKGIGPYRKAS